MKKHLVTVLLILLGFYASAQVPVLNLSIADANMLPNMKPSGAHFKVDRVYGQNLQTEYYFKSGVPTSPLSPFLASLHFNIISTYVDPSTGLVAEGYWTTEKVFSAFVNTIDFSKSMTHLVTAADVFKSDSTRIALDSLRMNAYQVAMSAALDNKFNKPNGNASQFINGKGELVSLQYLTDSTLMVVTQRFVSKDSIYNNPTWIGYLDYSTKLSNKPNLSVYETTSHASSTYQPIGSYYPLTGNPSNFLTSFTETDPIWSGVSANYRTKTQNDALYKAIGYVPSNAEVISALGYTPYNSTNPNGYISSVPAQSFSSLSGKPTSLIGYGITDAYPLSGNPSSFLTGITSAQVNSALGYTPYNGTTNPNGYLTSVIYPVTSVFGRTGAIVSANGDYTTSQVTEGSNLYFTNARARGAISALANGGITYNNSTGEISQTTPTYNNAPARALTTSFRPSTTRPTRVSYTISIATTLSLLNLNSSGTVALQISSDNSTWVTINQAGITRALAVSISVGLNDTSLINVAGEIPSGWYCRLVPATSGGATITLSSAQEVTY